MQPTQMQMYEAARKQIAETNALFLQMVDEGLTRRELELCIKRRPALWGRFAHWLDKLPEKEGNK